MLLRDTAAMRPSRADFRLPHHRASDAAGPARGIMLALALSSLAWMALALLVPRFW
jgi:divalent metal cation (Fe/Co/Zn/Cd) transporter